ncbi:MAG: ankyrin repeat domain-containing protein [Gammaproteobacteria bacterium]|nr:ankyrin repeat domain-containing protein [Gammaproteobacteria bacterium]
MAQNQKIDAGNIKKVPSIFSFNLDVNAEKSNPQIKFFRDTLQLLEIAYRNKSISIRQQDLVGEIKRAHQFFDGQGLNFFHWLIQYTQNFGEEHLNFLKFLFDLGVGFDVQDANGYSLLDLAITKGYLDLIKWLVKDVRLNIDDERRSVHSLVIAYHSHQKKQMLHEYIEIVNFICAHISSHSSSGNHLLHLAVRANDLPMVKWLLLQPQYEQSVLLKNHSGKSALMYALMYADETMVNYLIDKGSNLDERDLSGRHILHYFANFGYLEWLQAFELSAQIDLRDYKDEDHCSVLFYAVQSSNLELVQYLISKGFEISHEPGLKYSLPLYACKSKNVEIVKWLQSQGHIHLYKIENDGREMWLVDELSQNALHYATAGQSYPVTKWLIEELGADIESQDYEGATPLLSVLTHDESEESHQIVLYLLNQGANKTLKVKCYVEGHDSSVSEDFRDFALPFSHALIMKEHIKTLFQLLESEMLDLRTINHHTQNVFDMIMVLKKPSYIELMRVFLNAYNQRHLHDMIHVKSFMGYPIFAEHLISRNLMTIRDYDGDGDALIHNVVKFGETLAAIEYIRSFDDLNVNYKTKYGDTPLSLIVARNHFKFFKHFVEAFSTQLNFKYINNKGQHLFELLKEEGKQAWIDWMIQSLTITLNKEEQDALCFEVFQYQSFKEIKHFCSRMAFEHWVAVRKSDQKRPLTILIERFSDQEILQIMKRFAHHQVLTNLNEKRENFIELLRANHRHTLLEEFMRQPIEQLSVASLLSEVCQKESRAVVLDFCKIYAQINLNQAVGMYSPLKLIFERHDDELLKKFVLQFYGKRLTLENMDKDGQHLLDYLRQERRGLLNWFCNQKNFEILPLADDVVFDECVQVHEEKSDWQRYLFAKYMTPQRLPMFIDYLMRHHHDDVFVSYLRNRLLPYDYKDINDNNLLILALSNGHYETFARLMYDFYIGFSNAAPLIKQAFYFCKENQGEYLKVKWIEMMLMTQDKTMIEIAITELHYDWKTQNEMGFNLFEDLYQGHQWHALEWLIKGCRIQLKDTPYLQFFNEKPLTELKFFLGIFRKILTDNQLEPQLRAFDFEVAEAVMNYLDTERAMVVLKDVVYWHQLNDKKQSLLHICVLNHRRDLLPLMIEKTRDLLNYQDEFMRTALHYAASFNFMDMVNELLSMPDVQLQLHDGNSQNVLHQAVRYGQASIVNRALMECPQLFFVEDRFGATPIQFLQTEDTIFVDDLAKIKVLKQHVLGFFANTPIDTPSLSLKKEGLHLKK